jgi:hypothetical protein
MLQKHQDIVIPAIRTACDVADITTETLVEVLGRTTTAKAGIKKINKWIAELDAIDAANTAEDAAAAEGADIAEDMGFPVGADFAESTADMGSVAEDQAEAQMRWDELNSMDDLSDAEQSELDELTAELDDAQDDDEPARKQVVPQVYRARYKANGDASSCGDDMSQLLKAATTVQGEKGKPYCDIGAVQAIAEANELDGKFWGYVNSGLNTGMVRMNIGNLLRGKINREEHVIVGGTVWNDPAEFEGDDLNEDAA